MNTGKFRVCKRPSKILVIVILLLAFSISGCSQPTPAVEQGFAPPSTVSESQEPVKEIPATQIGGEPAETTGPLSQTEAPSDATAVTTPSPFPSRIYTDPELHVQLNLPVGWKAETADRFSGMDGFVELAIDPYPESTFDQFRTRCLLEADRGKMAAYGAHPYIAEWQGWDAEFGAWAGYGCTITPGGAPNVANGNQATLFARFPQPWDAGQLLVLKADPGHFEEIVRSLRFLDYSTPTPSTGFYDAPACASVPAGPEVSVVHLADLTISEYAIAAADCDPWNQFDGFQRRLDIMKDKIGLEQITDAAAKEPGINSISVGTDLIRFEYAGEEQSPVGAPSQVNIYRNDQIVYTLAIPQPGPAGLPVRGISSWNNHWLLEVENVLVQDGELMNFQLDYDEIFDWHLVDGEPLFFFRQGNEYGLSYAGQTLPPHYEDVIHGLLCCDPARYQVVSSPSQTRFFALRNGIWYLVKVETGS
jgi:hypothetical protein